MNAADDVTLDDLKAERRRMLGEFKNIRAKIANLDAQIAEREAVEWEENQRRADDERDALLICAATLRREGKTRAEIAAAIGRSKNSVTHLAGQGERIIQRREREQAEKLRS
jgi:hypothetical protein